MGWGTVWERSGNQGWRRWVACCSLLFVSHWCHSQLQGLERHLWHSRSPWLWGESALKFLLRDSPSISPCGRSWRRKAWDRDLRGFLSPLHQKCWVPTLHFISSCLCDFKQITPCIWASVFNSVKWPGWKNCFRGCLQLCYPVIVSGLE